MKSEKGGTLRSSCTCRALRPNLSRARSRPARNPDETASLNHPPRIQMWSGKTPRFPKLFESLQDGFARTPSTTSWGLDAHVRPIQNGGLAPEPLHRRPPFTTRENVQSPAAVRLSKPPVLASSLPRPRSREGVDPWRPLLSFLRRCFPSARELKVRSAPSSAGIAGWCS